MEEFLYLNRLYGSLNELVQAGGGNISVKNDKNEMIIKSSGYAFSDITKDSGYTILKLINFNDLLKSNNYDLTNLIINGTTPSIETYFHLFLKKYTIHLHPTLINIYMCSNKELPRLNESFIIIDYFKPGIELSKEIYNKYNNENIIFLKNHGIIFTSDNIDNLKTSINNCYSEFIKITKKYNFTNLESFEKLLLKYPDKSLLKISTYYQQKINIKNMIPYTPDIIVYLNNSLIEYENDIYIVANSKIKCYQILEIIKSYVILVESCSNTVLSKQQIDDLLLWDKEKFRTNIK